MWRSMTRLRKRNRSRSAMFAPSFETLEDRCLLTADGIGVYAPGSSMWELRSEASPGAPDAGEFQFGDGPIPIAGDWAGDGVDEIGTYRPSTRTWTLRSEASAGAADLTFRFGPRGIPVVGDWDGDGRDGIGIYIPESRKWHLRQTASAGTADAGVFSYGTEGVYPVTGDWDGDGVDGIGLFRRSVGRFLLREDASHGRSDHRFNFGAVKNALPVSGDWDGDGADGVGTFKTGTATWMLRNELSAGDATAGQFAFGEQRGRPVTGDFPLTSSELLTLTVDPLDLDLLGLEIKSSEITVTVSAQDGDGKLLGNLLTTVTGLIDLEEINGALNNVLATVVELVNSVDLNVAGVGSGDFSDAPESSTPILDLFVAPVELDLLGVIVQTSPIELSITAHAGQGLVLGNVLTAISDIFNPPLPDELDLATVNDTLVDLLSALEEQIPGIAPATLPPPNLEEGEILSLTVPAIDLDLLGLVLETSPITVNAAAESGDGRLLGNVLTVLLNELEATPDELSQLSGTLNNLLAKVVGVLNVSELVLPGGALDSLSDALQMLALPDLISSEPGQRADILDLVIASSDGTTPPVMVDLLGLEITTSDIDAHLIAETGDGNLLGNLVFNVANLLNPGGPASLIGLITDLASTTTSTNTSAGTNTHTGQGTTTTGPSTSTSTNTELEPDEPAVPVLTLELPPIDLDLLGLEVQSSAITITVSAQSGDGELLGNALTALSTLINGPGVSSALNNVLENVVSLVNSVDLEVDGLVDGELSSAPAESTRILELFVAPVYLDLLGVLVETSPIELTVTAHAGDGLLLGNILTALTDVFNPPLPEELDLVFINDRLDQLLADLDQYLPNIPPAPIPATVFTDDRILSLAVPAIDLNLLGLVLETSPIVVNADAHSGDGMLLGNILQTVLNTLDATPEQLSELSGNVNEILARVVGVLNVSSLTLPGEALDILTGPLETLALPDLIAEDAGARTQILDLIIASTDGTSPPVDVDLLGLVVTTSEIDVELWAETGDGQVLGNLLYNVANLLNPDSPAGLLLLLTQLAAR